MADNRGGYRRPRKPAPVSGPGAASRRTDGQVRAQLPDAAYGEQQTFQADQAGATMDRAPGALSMPSGASPAPAADLSSVVPFGAPSQRPGEPVTAGAASGAGPGVASLGLGASQLGDDDPGVQSMARMLPTFELAAMLPTASVAFRQFVRRLRGSAYNSAAAA